MSTDRPQYGEYATPEEQRARAGLPPQIEQTPASDPAPYQQQSQSPAQPQLSSQPAHAPVASVNPVGRLVTFVLLGFGLFNVLTSIPQFLNMSDTLAMSMEMLGLDGEFTSYAAARTWGLVAVFVLVTGYAATVWWSLRRLRSGRSAWWVPLVGFAVTMTLVSACISVVMFSDPAFTAGLMSPPAG